MQQGDETVIQAPATGIGIDPYWMNVASVTVGLSFNSGKGALTGSVVGYTGATQITGNAVLERLNSNGTYTQVASWNNLYASGNMLFFSETYYVSRGYTYRLTLTTTTYIKGVGETVSGSHSAYAD